MKTNRCLSAVDLFFTGLCGLCNQRLFWLKSTWHKKTAAFLMSVANLRCQLVLTLHRQIWGHTGLGYIKISHQQHSSGGGRARWEQGSPKVERRLCVRAARTVTVRSTGQEAEPEQDGEKALQRGCALSCLSSLQAAKWALWGLLFLLRVDSKTWRKMLTRTRGHLGS